MITACEFISRFNKYIKGRENILDVLYMIVNVNIDGKVQRHYLCGLNNIYKDFKDKGPRITYDDNKESIVLDEIRDEELEVSIIPRLSILIPKGKKFTLSEFKEFITIMRLGDYDYNKQYAMVQHVDRKFKYIDHDKVDPEEELNYLINTRTLIEFSSLNA